MSLHHDRPGRGNASIVSAGLCELPAVHRTDGFRQEVIFSALTDQADEMFLEDCGNVIAAIARDEHRLRLRQGEARPVARPIWNSSGGLTHLMADLPQYFPEPVWSVGPGQTPLTALVWLIPLFTSEVRYLEAEGYEALGSLFEAADPDLLDLGRSPVI
jgi:hypothetical protein